MSVWPQRIRSALLALLLAGCTAGPPTTRPPAAPPEAAPPAAEKPPSAGERQADARATRVERGRVSHYGKAFEGRKTASGEIFDPEALTMAHRTLPFGTRVRVTNLENRRSVDVVVNDRGPFVDGRIADLSTAAARAIGMVADGVVEAAIEILAPAAR
jgi:rare lipoprotein A